MTITPVEEMLLKHPPGMGFGFTVGDRYQHTLVFRTEVEARANRKRIMDAYGAVAEVIEREKR